MTMLGSDGVIMGAGTNEYLLPAETSSSQHHMAFAPGRMPSAGDINVGSPIFTRVQAGGLKGTLPDPQGSFNYTNESRNCIVSSNSNCQIINVKADFYTPLLTRMES